MKNISTLSLLLLHAFCAMAQITPRLVLDLSPGFANTQFGVSAAFHNKLVFTADDVTVTTDVHRIWISDGTNAGTFPLKDLTGGQPHGFQVLGDKLYFIGGDGATGEELWATNGTATGTQVVKDIRPGSASAVIGDPVVISGKLYFLANDGSNGTRLWESDGTGAGTTVISDLLTISTTATFGNMVGMNGKLYIPIVFDNSTQFMAIEPVTQNTTYLHLAGKMVDDVIVANNRLFFTMRFENGGTSYPSFYFLSSDGTQAGTGSVAYNIRRLGEHVEMDGKLYFYATSNYTTGSHINGLWVSDGTEAGTRLVKDPLLTNCTAIGFTVFRNKIYFGCGGTTPYNNELWISDGTTEGTQKMMSFSASGAGLPEIYPSWLTVAHDLLYFKAWDSTTRRVTIWVSDGSAAGTRMVTNPAVSGFYTNSACEVLRAPMRAADTTIFFGTSYDVYNTGTELYALSAPFPSKDTVADSTYTFSVNCYPNPVSADLTIDIVLPDTAVCTISLTGIDGRLISQPREIKYTKPGRQRLSYPMGHLPKGLYLLQLTSGKHKQYHKIVVYH